MAQLQNRRHELFAREYVRRSFNGSAAARAAGSAAHNVAQAAHELLRRPDIIKRVNELVDDWYGEITMDVDHVKAEISALASFNQQDCFDENGQLLPVHEMPRETAAGVNEINRSVDRDGVVHTQIKAGKDKRGALDMLARINNAYEPDNISSGTITLQIDEKDAAA